MFKALEKQLAHERAFSRDSQSEVSGKPTDATIIDAADIYVVEASTLPWLGDIELRQRIASYRGILRNLLDRETYANLMAQGCQDLRAASKPQLLDEAHGLLGRLHRRYVLIPAVEDLRARIARDIIGVVALVVALFLFSAWLWPRLSIPQGYQIAAIAGAFGATVSTIMRLYDVEPRHEPLLTWLNLERGQASLWVAPILGAAFASILLLIMRSKMVDGALFPEFDSKDWTGLQFTAHCMLNSCPDLTTDAAKLFVWCFLAGWAERMVPDVLNRLLSHPGSRVTDRVNSKQR